MSGLTAAHFLATALLFLLTIAPTSCTIEPRSPVRVEPRYGVANACALAIVRDVIPECSPARFTCPAGTARQTRALDGWHVEACTRDGVLHGPALRRNRRAIDLLARGSFVDGLHHGVHELWRIQPEGVVLVEQRSWQHGTLHGPALSWTDDGHLLAERAYVDGLEHGATRLWDETGQQLSETEWRAGERHGRERIWAADGTLRGETMYVDGAPHGTERQWHPNGQLGLERTHGPSGLESVARSWSADGTLTAEVTYLEGERHGTERLWNRDGTLVAESTWKHGLADGPHRMWDDRGTLRIEAPWTDGRLHGVLMRWHENGQVETVARYEHGLEHGDHESFADDGAVLRRTPWADGQRHGTAREWSRDGQLLSEVEYDHGARHGTARTWSPEATLVFVGSYLHGLPDGKHEYFDATGRLERREDYRRGLLEGQREQYRDGDLVETAHYRDGRRDGAAAEYDALGRETRSCTWTAGKPGTCRLTTWHGESQQRAREEHRLGASVDGRVREWYADGTLSTDGVAVAGEPVGTWTWYHSNGTPSNEFLFVLVAVHPRTESVRDGVWRSWDAAGQLRRQVSWALGRLDGPLQAWNAAGELVESGHYEGGLAAGDWMMTLVLPESAGGGTLVARGAMRAGTQDGVWSYFADDDDDELPIGTCEFAAGERRACSGVFPPAPDDEARALDLPQRGRIIY